MKIKLNFNVNLKKTFQYISLVLLTALLISTTLVALPLTEKISEKLTFNLNTKDSQYWSKEYFVKVESKDEKEIKKIKEVFYRRLRGFGVENSTIFVEGGDNEKSQRFPVQVQAENPPNGEASRFAHARREQAKTSLPMPEPRAWLRARSRYWRQPTSARLYLKNFHFRQPPAGFQRSFHY